MKVLMIEPGKVPYETEIENSLRAMQAAVGGKIQTVEFSDDPAVLICNQEGKMKGLPLNRPLHDSKGEVYDIIAGRFFVAGAGEDNFCDLPDHLLKKYEEELKGEAKEENSINDELDRYMKEAQANNIGYLNGDEPEETKKEETKPEIESKRNDRDSIIDKNFGDNVDYEDSDDKPKRKRGKHF